MNRKIAYIIGALLLATPVMADDHRRSEPRYNSSREDLSYQGWQRRTREREQEEYIQRRQDEMDRQERHETFDKLYGNQERGGGSHE